VHVSGDWPEPIDNLRRDFVWFEPDQDGTVPPDLNIKIERRPPDLDRFGPLVASFVTPRNVVYQGAGFTVVDYFGKAVSVLDRNRGHLTVQGEDEHLVHEAAYLYLLSRFGEHLESKGLTRLHALALAGPSGAMAVLLPSGGGKSTLALRALQVDGVRILSEDSPLLDRRGRLHPFPLRIGINAIDADRIEPSAQRLRHVVIGRRTLGREARLERLPRAAAIGTLMREAVLGVGIYQGLEFILQRGLRDVVGKLDVALLQ
jgi:hypothetical protein